MDDIPRFDPTSKKADWPWVNCSVGDAEMQEKFMLLHRLNIPLGQSQADCNCRRMILRRLIVFEESVMGKEKHIIEGQNGKPHYLMKVPPTFQFETLRKKSSGKQNRLVEIFLDCLSNETGREQAASLLCKYFCKFYNEIFLAHVEEALEIDKKNRKKIPFVPIENLIMYDGGDPTDQQQTMWNIKYTELLKFKEDHGNCLVGKSSGEKYRNLARWVSSQRTNKRQNKLLSPKRMELLESVGFVWVVNTNQHNNKDDPRMHRAIAAKLFFHKTLLAREALRMGGFSQEIACDCGRKKQLNLSVSKFYKKEMKCKNSVLQLVEKLKEYASDDMETAVADVFGDSEIIPQLHEEGKLIPRGETEEPPAKKQRTDEDSTIGDE